MKSKEGFLFLDAVVGMFIISVVTAIVFSWSRNQSSIVKGLYFSDLATRTAVNVMLRDFLGSQSFVPLNGFELVRYDGKIVLKIEDQHFGYAFAGEEH